MVKRSVHKLCILIVIFQITDKNPTGSGNLKGARLRQKEDSPSSSDDGSTARKNQMK